MKTMTWAMVKRMMVVVCLAAAVASLAGELTTTLVAAQPDPSAVEAIKTAPVNQWTALPEGAGAGYRFSALVYAPPRGQLLHWGAVAPDQPRNDVRAFDAVAGAWTSDQPGDVTLPKGLSAVWYSGTGTMLPSGRPLPAAVVNGVCYDSKRRQLVCTMPGLMAAYDPVTKTWKDLKAKTIIDGREYPGGPPCYGIGACYDPANDEILLFPHYGGLNLEMLKVDGRVTAHYGTMVYRFTDNTWRRVGDILGSDEMKAARKTLLDATGKASRATDGAWSLRRLKGAATPRGVADGFAEAAADLARITLPAAREAAGKVGQSLKDASKSAAAGQWEEALAAGGRAMWLLEELRENVLRVEPPARCGTPLVCDPKRQVVVMFGGHNGLVRTDLRTPRGYGGTPGSLNDTWLYDLKTRQWRDVSKTNRPPVTLWPQMVYDPASGLVLLVTRERADRGWTITVWGFDAGTCEWSQLDRQAWPWPVDGAGGYGWTGSSETVGLDEKAAILVLVQHGSKDKQPVQQTYVLRLDVSKMQAKPAPVSTAPESEPVRPLAVPPDDPAVAARLKSLPANTWVHVKPPNDGATRDWGNIACDPVRGWLIYFGGGHATYQVNDVAVYNPGANRWAYTVGEHNDWIPPVSWGGACMSLRGGEHAHHMYNRYHGVDGRMYTAKGTESMRWQTEDMKKEGARHAWFCDLDRGGVWRRAEVASVQKENGAIGTYGECHFASPDGRIMGFGGGLEPYNGRFFPGSVYFGSYDGYANRLTVTKVGGAVPDPVLEYRPFCFVPDKGEKGQVFVYEFAGQKDPATGAPKIQRQRTWLYDVATNTFTDLKPKRQPPDGPRTVEYVNGQDAVLAVIGRGPAQWVYSFKHNTWAPLPVESDDPQMNFASPYAQMVYSAKYGVFVNVGSASRGTAVMRPDFSRLTWE